MAAAGAGGLPPPAHQGRVPQARAEPVRDGDDGLRAAASIQESGAARRLRLARPGRSAIVLGALAALVCTFYLWTAFTSGPGTAHYDLLTSGILDGRASLPITPAPEMLALPDPYDPAQNAPYRLHDASLYQGRYYLYFGPTPVFLVHIPLRLFGVHASDALAASLLAIAGFLFTLALARFLIARYRPSTSLATRCVVLLLLGLANVVPFLLRRPAVYEVAIAAGYCCLAAALHLTLTGALRERPSPARLAGGSLALGLAVGARPHLILALPLLAWAWHRAWRARGGGRSTTLRLAAAVAAPLGACLVLLALYNLVRFGSLTEFGANYQLAGINTRTLDHFSLGRLVPGSYFYLLAPPTLDTVFPFAHLTPTYPGTLPAAYVIEPVAGCLATTPFLALAFAAPVLLLVSRRGRWREPMTLATLLLVTGLLVLAAPMLGFDAATMRYEVDFVPLLLLAVLLVWLWVEDALGRSRLASGLARSAGAVAATVAVLFALAFSITGYYDSLRAFHPGVYRAIERVVTLGTASDPPPG